MKTEIYKAMILDSSFQKNATITQGIHGEWQGPCGQNPLREIHIQVGSITSELHPKVEWYVSLIGIWENVFENFLANRAPYIFIDVSE